MCRLYFQNNLPDHAAAFEQIRRRARLRQWKCPENARAQSPRHDKRPDRLADLPRQSGFLGQRPVAPPDLVPIRFRDVLVGSGGGRS